MNIRTFAIAAGALALGLAAWITPGNAQGPLWDVVKVTLPYSVTVGDRTLQPGDYTIQQLRDPGGASRVLLIYSDNGMKFETSAMTIPALDQNTARDTRVVLHHFGNDYYFDKVWIQGKDYGYEFPLPNSVKSREKERMEPVSVAASYSTMPAQTNSNETTAQSATTTQQTTTAQSATTTQQTTTAPSATTTQQTTTPAAHSATTTPQATQTPTTAQSTMAPATTPSTANNTANREMPQATTPPAATTAATTRHTMPNTSAGWLMMMLSGGALSGAGLSLRRKR
jgi:hypothetical protein